MIKQLLNNPSEAFASPLILWLVYEYGSDAITFEPETIRDCFKSVDKDCPESIITRVNAALALLTTNRFWIDPLSFGITCRALNRHKFPGAGAPDASDLAWGVTEAILLTSDTALSTSPGNMFSDSVHRFVTVTLKDSGLYTVPEYLKGFKATDGVPGISDASLAVARQEESDRAAAKVDEAVSGKLVAMFSQIAALNVPLIESATKELKGILSGQQ